MTVFSALLILQLAAIDGGPAESPLTQGPGVASEAIDSPDAGAPIANETLPEVPARDDVTPSAGSVVTASRVARDPWQQPRAVTVVSAEELQRRGARSTPEALLESEGVFLQKTNHGGGAPIIRGLYGQQVLLLVDGMRLNNSTVRAGPNQFLNTIDPFTIDQLEVVRGPGSVLYGSDALGGVVNVRTYWPRYKLQLSGNGLFRGQVSTADESVQGHLRGGVSLENTAFSAALTLRDFDDLRGGALVGVQQYTAYEEGDATLKFRQRLGPSTEVFAQYQQVRQQNAPRLDRSFPGDFRRFTSQYRDFGHVRLVSRGLGVFKEVEVEASLHRQGDLTERFRVSRDRVDHDFVTVWTTGARAEGDIDLPQFVLGPADLIVGADAYYDRVPAGFTRTAISDGQATATNRPVDARYPPTPTMLSTGVFALLSGDDQRPLSYRGGVRVQFNSTHLPEDARLSELFPGTPVFPAADVRTLGVAAELGVRQQLPMGFQAVANLGTGFRSPNVDDYLRLGAEGPGFLIPGRDLVSEQSYSAEGGVRWISPAARAQAFYSFTLIPGLVGNVPTTVDGQAFNPDGLPYLARMNRDSAVIHSVEAAAELRPVPSVTLSGHLSWTLTSQRRRDLTDPAQPLIVEPLSRTAPLNGVLRATWEVRSDVFIEGIARAAAPQAALSEADRLDSRICPETFACNGTPGFVVLHLRAGYKFLEKYSLSATLQNLTDATYRTHGSGVDEAGRSVVLSVEGKL